MDRTEEVETLKKEIFKIDFSLKIQEHSSDEYKRLIRLKAEKSKQLEYLNKELEESKGQLGFAFVEQMDLKENVYGL